ncbi:TPA: RNA-guided endonuclease TnpB family protein [Listeria monocytogenes]
MKEVDSLALANAQLNLDKAYKNFFRDKSVGFPRFKSKKNPVQSYTTNNQNGTVAIIDNKFIKIPKLKSLLRIKLHKELRICMEDLNTKGMLRNHKLAKSISDVSWSSFVTKLQYKANWYRREIIQIDKQFPSSQICSECGHKYGKKPLGIRKWNCPACHTQYDRDIHASINILTEGLRVKQLAYIKPRTIGTKGIAW